MSILIVNEDSDERSKIKNVLREVDVGRIFDFHEVMDVKAANDSLQSRSYDCVFLNHNLPKMDGIDILKKARDQETDLLRSPVIITATQDCDGVVWDALRFGAQDYILKENISPTHLKLAMTKAKEHFELKRNSLQAQEELQHVRKMEAVGRLTSGVAHDFNNLLTVVMGNIHLLRRRFLAGPENYDVQDMLSKIEAIETVSDKGAELVRRLMIFTRQSALAQEIVEVNECIHETFELLKRTLGEAIEIDMILSDVSWQAYLDPIEFENTLINFAVNARDAMPNGGKLTIETENVILDETYALRHPDITAGPYVMVAISDNGVGMSPEIMKYIFEPFFTTKPPGEGTGLGMSMAYGFVRQCGGALHVYSEEGHGTVFRIYLPKLVTDADEVHVPEKTTSPTGGETILVAEDDDDLRGVAVSMLEKLGYKTLQAKTGRVALELLKLEHKRIDMLFTDIVMPGDLNGIELVKEIRERYPHVKTLLTSGYSENAIPNYQLTAGEELISKPYRRDVLAAKLRKIFDGDSDGNT